MGAELAQLVTNHGLGDVHGNMLAAVVNGDGVTDHLGEDGGRAGPGLHDVLLASLVHRDDTREEARLYERALFETSAHKCFLLTGIDYFLRRRMMRSLDVFFLLRVR